MGSGRNIKSLAWEGRESQLQQELGKKIAEVSVQALACQIFLTALYHFCEDIWYAEPCIVIVLRWRKYLFQMQFLISVLRPFFVLPVLLPEQWWNFCTDPESNPALFGWVCVPLTTDQVPCWRENFTHNFSLKFFTFFVLLGFFFNITVKLHLDLNSHDCEITDFFSWHRQGINN